MNNRRWFPIVALTSVSAMLVLASCGDDGDSTEAGQEVPEQPFEQTSEISDCGGFDGMGQALTIEGALTVDEATYCDAEVLHWEYNAEAKTLQFLDTRMELNCCGLHTMTAAEVDDVLVLTERDAPESEGMRCGCMCIFDFGITLTGIEEEQRAIEVILDVTDNGGPQSVFAGTINLADGGGQIVLDDSESTWCGDPGQ